MKKFKLIALALLASTFGLTSCDVPEFMQPAADWARTTIPGADKLIPGGEEKEGEKEEKNEEEEEKAEVVSVKINTQVSTVTDETEPFKLSVKVEVKGNASKEVTWSSSDESVATVDDSGLVTPKAAGSVSITATSVADPSQKDSVSIEVVAVPGIVSVAVESESSEVAVGSTLQLNAVVAAKGTAALGVTWSSSDESVATIDQNGLLTPVKGGTVTVTATSKFDPTKSGSKEITVVSYGLHPQLLEDGWTFSQSFPSEAAEAFAGTEVFAFETPEGFYFKDIPAESDEDLNVFAIYFEYNQDNVYAFAEILDAGYAYFYDSYYQVNCFIDPSISFEVDLDYTYLDSSYSEVVGVLYFYHIDELWGEFEVTSDSEWSEEASAAMEELGVQLPFVALGSEYEASFEDGIFEIYDYCPDFHLLDDYESALLEAGFEKVETEEELYYTIPVGEELYIVEFGFTSAGNAINAYKYEEPKTFADALEELNALMKQNGVHVELNLPEPEEFEYGSVTYSSSSDRYRIICSSSLKDTAYNALLGEEPYNYELGVDSYGYPIAVNDNFRIEPWNSGDYLLIDVYVLDQGEAQPEPFADSISFADLGLENATVVESFTLESGAVVEFGAGANENNKPIYYSTGTGVRTYKFNTITISAPEGGELSSISFTMTQHSKAMTADCGTWDEDTLTWTAPEEGATSVTFTVEDGSGHNRISAISVEGLALPAGPVIVPAEFPQETVDAYFAGLGYQDTLPAFTGTASEYNLTEGGQLQIFVGAGNEADALAQYQADLLAAGYTEIGPDQYGDMHYASPNFEIDVCPWDGSAWSSDGYVIVDTKAYSAPTLSFPLESVNAYLAANELGFQFSQADADAIDSLKVEGSAYIIEEGSMYGYPYLNIAIEGECAEAVEAALAASLAAAGFVWNESYKKYYNDDYISFSFSEDSGYTSIFIF